MTESECPLCSIPEREPILYSDDIIYLVKTSKMKGHKVRVMACTYRHTDNPTIDEQVRMFITIQKHMSVNCPGIWYLCDSTHCSIPQHAHFVACDGLGTPEELELLSRTEKVRFP